MTLPGITLSIVIASLYGSLYHLVRSDGGKRLLLYLILSWIGFGLGHWMGEARHWMFFRLGAINLGTATIGSYLLLGLGDWLSRYEFPTNPTKP